MERTPVTLWIGVRLSPRGSEKWWWRKKFSPTSNEI